MKIETKYDIGQAVRVLSYGSVRKVADPCPACTDSEHPGQVLLGGKRYICPECKGEKVRYVEAYGWHVGEGGTIACIECERQSISNQDDDSYRAPNRDSYRLGPLGVRWIGGSVYDERRIWPGTREDAQAECDRRNEAHEGAEAPDDE